MLGDILHQLTELLLIYFMCDGSRQGYTAMQHRSYYSLEASSCTTTLNGK